MLSLSTSIIKQENVLPALHAGQSDRGFFFNQGSLFTDDPSLHQVDKTRPPEETTSSIREAESKTLHVEAYMTISFVQWKNLNM